MEIPSQLSQINNRYKPYAVLGDVDEDKLMELMKDLEDSKTVLFPIIPTTLMWVCH